ncbi:Imm8 family immunity protein [Arthrobacter sp. 35W]|uniref:Imm8 family immunity protein n=1 Tax=Arthrobacter sp. 35W TaxID=1132441 RepID=UPI00047E0DF7|nr:Imm8 family immunity protein [Arthrobacter sp. 35W]
MRAELKTIFSSDVDIAAYQSVDPNCDGVWLQLGLGPVGAIGADNFQLLACTPAWLQQLVERDGPMTGRHTLIMDTLDLVEARRIIVRWITALDAPTWVEISDKFGRYAHSEFEDYRPFKEGRQS